MPKVVVRVERDPASQPPWARKFLLSLGFKNHSQAAANKIEQIQLDMAAITARKHHAKIVFGPFELPVTLTFNTKSWVFTWTSEAEQTMFLLRWS